MRVHAVVVASM